MTHDPANVQIMKLYTIQRIDGVHEHRLAGPHIQSVSAVVSFSEYADGLGRFRCRAVDAPIDLRNRLRPADTQSLIDGDGPEQRSQNDLVVFE